MHVDEPTLLLFSALTALVTGAMFFGLARAIDGVPGLRWWSAGFFCVALAFGSDRLPAPERVGSLLFNLPFAFGHVLMLVGTLQFTERPRPRAALGVLAALTVADPIVFAFMLPLAGVRMMMVAGVDAVVRTWTAHAFLGHRGSEARLGYRVAGTITLLEAFGGFGRAFLALTAPQTISHRVAEQSPINLLSWGTIALDTVVWGQMVMLLVALRLVGTIREAANHDPLTHCLNRRGLRLALDAPLAAAYAAHDPVAVLMFDVDHFKQVNDRHGHAAGDEVLETLGRVLRDEENASTLAARWGGEEFIVVGCGLSGTAAPALAERVRARFATATASIAGLDGGCTLSVGIARQRLEVGLELRTIRAAADDALYAAKRHGRDRVEVAPLPPSTAGTLAPA